MANLTPYSGLPGFTSLRREIDRLFDVLRSDQGDNDRNIVWAPRADLSESDDAYVIRMDVPGLSKDAVDVQLHDGTLTVSGERRSEHEEQDERMHRVERAYGRFYRSFSLPQAGNPENVAAEMNDGVLTIRVPKREESKPRKIAVR